MVQRISTVYKYFNISTKEGKTRVKEIFEKNKIWFSSPKELNDPFEFRFSPSFEASKKQKLKKCIELLEESYDSNIANKQAVGLMANRQKFKSWEQKNSRGLKKKLDSATCLCCFSTVPDDILMWSHYANGHKGICLRFSYKNEEHEDFFKKISTVSYPKNNNLPKFNFYKESLENFKKKVLLTKAKSWKYEKECRGIAFESHEEYKIIPKEIINGIILGVKFKNRDLSFIKEIKNYNNSLAIYRSKLDIKKYKLIFEKINL